MNAPHIAPRAHRRLAYLLPGMLAAGIALASASAAHEPASGAPAAASTTSSPATPALDGEAALRASRSAVGGTPGDYAFLDTAGQPVRLSSYRGKPLLVNFVYTGCFHVCPTSTLALHKAVTALRERFGARQFNVVTVGFNQPADSPEALGDFAERRRIAEPNWAFLSPDRAEVAALARDFGFSYVATPAGFDHTLQVTLLDAEGRIYRQIYGDWFTAAAIGEPLKDLLTGARIADGPTLSDLIERVRILCSVYDPATGTYRADYTLYFEIAGGVTFVVAMLWFAAAEWRARAPSRRPLSSG